MLFLFGKPEHAVDGALAVEDSGGGLQPSATELIAFLQRRQGAGIECAQCRGRVEGDGAQLPLLPMEEGAEESVCVDGPLECRTAIEIDDKGA